jgi:hypothetical protein
MTKKYAKVEGHSNLIRDLSTNAIINTDSVSSSQYDLIRKKRQDEKLKIEKLENELNEIKSLLQKLTNDSR